MSTVFPRNYLPEPAQPWAREVQKQLANVIVSNRANEINNATRDNQLNSSLISLTSVVADVKTAAQEANDAINGLIGLGSAGSEYTLNASNITAGTISGVTFITTGGSLSTTLSSGTINFSKAGSSAATISAGTDGSNNYVQITSAGGSGQLTVGSDYSVLSGSDCAVQPGVVSSGRIDITGSSVFCNAAFTTNANLTAPSISGGSGTFNSALQSSNIPGNFLGSGAVDVYASNTLGRLGVQSSSKTTKQEINAIDLSVESILSIQPKTFKYNVDVTEFGLENTSTVIGFIAEDLDEAGLGYFVHYGSDGKPESIPYSKYVVALQAVVRNLNDRITTLENGAN